MANPITDWRLALEADLAAQYPAALIDAGTRSGTSRNKDRIAVFLAPAGAREQSGRVVVGEATLLVRYWPRNPKIRDNGSPLDETELEQAGWALATFLQTKQTAYTALGIWFCRLTGWTIDADPEEWGVEATVVAQFDNPAVLA